jgi:hypothetical protein
METVAIRWLITEDMSFYQHGIQKLITRADKCFNYRGYYAKRQWDGSKIKPEWVLLQLKTNNQKFKTVHLFSDYPRTSGLRSTVMSRNVNL